MVRQTHNPEMPSAGIQLLDKGWLGNPEKGYYKGRIFFYLLLSLVLYAAKFYTIVSIFESNNHAMGNAEQVDKGNMTMNPLSVYEMTTYNQTGIPAGPFKGQKYQMKNGTYRQCKYTGVTTNYVEPAEYTSEPNNKTCWTWDYY